MSDYQINSEQGALDAEFIIRALHTTYWAGQRSRDDILASLGASLCFGAYAAETGAQVGFARVVTDGVTFAWLCDVYVAPEHRGHGLGKRLVTAVLQHPRVIGTKVHLGTRDAHGLYERFGFQRCELMRFAPPPSSPSTPPAPGADAPVRA